MSTYTNLPAPSPEGGLSRYLQQIRKFPMLEPEEEYMLAKRWVEEQDTEAAHKMVSSHLRLAAKIAMGYRGYGLPQAEVISEANVGLMQAVKRFDPEKGFRLATYARWWIRACIQEYVLRSWSLVKLGTTGAQKKLFFNLRKAKARIGALEEGDLHPEKVTRIANDLGVTEAEVISMNRRLSGGDASLNATVGSEGEGSMQWQDWLEDESADQAGDYEASDELEIRRALMTEAMTVLNEREQDILTNRRLRDQPLTLEDLSVQYSVSRERIRQIEVRAFEKLQMRMQSGTRSWHVGSSVVILHQSKSIGSLTCPGLIYDTWVYPFELLKRQTDKKLGAMPWRFYKTLPEWQVQIGPTCAYRSAVRWWISYLSLIHI